jgi:hypothetical protein
MLIRFASLFALSFVLAVDAYCSAEPLETELAYEAVVEIAGCVDVGDTPQGHRMYVPILGGTFEGPSIRGVVLPGGADWQTARPDGVLEVDALYSMKCDDGTVIVVHNRGTLFGDYARTTTRFDAPEGPHDWLNKFQFVGSVSGGPRPGTVTIRVFKVR